MYKVLVETPRGIFEFIINDIQELEGILLENLDYTGVSARRIEDKRIKLEL